MANHRLRADPNKLGQVIRNLVSNSIKFTPRNGLVAVELQLIDGRALMPMRRAASQRSVSRAAAAPALIPPLHTDLYSDVFLRVTVKDTGAGLKKVSVDHNC